MPLPSKQASWIIEKDSSFFDLDARELFSYRHLLFRLVRKEFLINYQQTLLGPVWVLFQPLLTMITYVFVFNKIIGVSIGKEIPPILFYFSAIILWNFFNDSFSNISKTFRDNAHIFGKVYFPRLIVPLSSLITQLFRFLIQFVFFIAVLLYFVLFKGFVFHFTTYTLALLLVVACLAIIGLSTGLIFSVITAKYRDLGNFTDILIRVLLFITPIIYPLSLVRANIRWIVQLNPLTPLFELFRLGLLGYGTCSTFQLLYCVVFTIISLLTAIMLFNKMGSRLIDVL